MCRPLARPAVESIVYDSTYGTYLLKYTLDWCHLLELPATAAAARQGLNRRWAYQYPLHPMQLWFGPLLAALLASNGVSSHSATAESTVSAGYSAVATRANGARPIISSHDAGSGAGFHTARSTFTFNFNPTLLTLPDGTQALLIRSSNGTNASTASTKTNPDYLTQYVV